MPRRSGSRERVERDQRVVEHPLWVGTSVRVVLATISVMIVTLRRLARGDLDDVVRSPGQAAHYRIGSSGKPVAKASS